MTHFPVPLCATLSTQHALPFHPSTCQSMWLLGVEKVYIPKVKRFKRSQRVPGERSLSPTQLSPRSPQEATHLTLLAGGPPEPDACGCTGTRTHSPTGLMFGEHPRGSQTTYSVFQIVSLLCVLCTFTPFPAFANTISTVESHRTDS